MKKDETNKEGKIYTKEELLKKLTDKERIFCHEYIIDWNGSRAAKVAGYSEKSAKEIAHATLTKVHNQQYIEFIKDDIEKEAGITKLRQLNELAKIAYSSIAHLHNTWIELKDFESLTDDQKDAIESTETKTESKGKFNEDTQSYDNVEVKMVKVKLYSKLGAIDQINKMLGYNAADKIDHTTKGESIVDQKTINITVDGKDINLGT
jgi:hypothetical protein